MRSWDVSTGPVHLSDYEAAAYFAAQQGNAVDAFGRKPVRFSSRPLALAQLIAVVRRPWLYEALHGVLARLWQDKHTMQLLSSLSPSECASRLRAVVQHANWMTDTVSAPLVGRVQHTAFVLRMRKEHWHNAFEPVLYGNIRPHHQGSLVIGTFRPALSVLLFLGGIVVFVLVAALQTRSFAPLCFLAPIGMMVLFGYSVSAPDKDAIIRLLQQHLQAQNDEAVVARDDLV